MHKKDRSTGRIGNKLLSAKGMTLAEMLIVVAIIVVLGGVAVISLIQYQEMLAQKERDSIAKQLFIAAQNHLAVAKGEGYLGTTLSKNMSDATKKEVFGIEQEDGSYVFVQGQGSQSLKGDGSTILDQMLPLGSIDETVRAGNYIIRYQPETAKVLDVFYSSIGSGRFDCSLDEDDISDALDLKDEDDKQARRDFKGKNKMLGYYGGADLDVKPVAMRAPSMTIDNGEQLRVTVTENNSRVSGAEICLMIRGVESKGELAVFLKSTGGRVTANATSGVYTYIIDDVTTENMHFCQLTSQNENKFIAGEDLLISAVAFSNTQLATIARSEEKKTNSLYQSIAENVKTASTDPDKSYTAFISRCRHLENLEEEVSNTGMKEGVTSGNKDILLTAAAQTADLTWNTGWNVYGRGGTLNQSGGSFYWPVSYATSLIYDGQRHSVKDIKTTGHSNAGMFGIMANKSGIKDLMLINCSVISSSTGNAGTLAGSTTGTNIENVVSYVEPVANQSIRTTRANHVVRGGNAGGLVGTMSGGNIRYCAAAMPVIAGTCAGGLVAQTTGGVTIRTSYSGGYTENGIYNLATTGDYNIQSGGTAGGLVGSAGDTDFKWCYSTCSVDGSPAASTGGFVGTSSGSINSCYCTGLVSGAEANNAFRGSGGTLTGGDNSSYYYEIVNEYEKGGSINYKGSGFGNDSKIASIDDSENIYNAFVSDESTWNRSVPYDDFLASHYRNSGDSAYPLKTVTQLMASSKDSIAYSETTTGKYFVNTHYGDWPAPEMFFVNN